MKRTTIYWAAAALIGAAWISLPENSRAQNNNRKPHISIEGPADNCAGLKVRSSGEIARAEENYTTPKGSTLEIDAAARGHIRVIGSDRSDFQIHACKIAVAVQRADAERELGRLAVTRSGGRFTSSGPSEGEWLIYFIVHAPKDAALDLETRNGPIAVLDVTGRIRTRVINGPISLQNCGGDVQARTTNGPIQFKGTGGNVSLSAQNGPVAVELSGDEWKGPLLEARTVNGPVSLHLPDTYRSGVQVETSGWAPFACQSEVCRNARTEANGQHRSIRMNGSTPLVRLSTERGPVAVQSQKRGPKII